ncbi:MAG: serine/threonine-protein kinase, partial [Myxococcota bacterium]
MLDLQPGAVIGGYQIRRKLGQGGMGAVYLAHDHKLEVDRALKIIALSDSMLSRVDEQEYRTRFIREARTLARLRHPGIIAVQVVDEVDNNPYIVMEFFRGSDLRTWLFDAMPGPDVVLSIGRQIASALAHAHDAAIIHRDLKLSNILINKNE